jgi:hypothetical protein
MKTITIIAIVLLSILAISLIPLSCTSLESEVIGSSQLETKEFDFKDFTAVEIGTALNVNFIDSDTFKVNISQSDSYHVSITANQNLLDYLVVTDDGGTLRINLKSFHRYNRITLEAQITMPAISSLQLSGASRGELNGFKSLNELSLEISEASELNMNDMEAGDSRFEVSGASTVTGTITVVTADFNISEASTVELTGSANEVDVQGSGASLVRLAVFSTSKAKFNLSGASNGIIDVSDQLDIILSGASRLVYSGNPNLGSVIISKASTLNHA